MNARRVGRPKEIRGLYLSKRMLSAYPNGFCGGIISGQRGIGKSSFALTAVWELYRLLGYDEETSWSMALNRCKFTINDVVDFIEKNIKSDKKEHVLIWDDAGVHASTMEWWTNRDSLKRLKGVLDTIRTGVCSLLLTTPSESSLTKILRDYDDYIIQIGYTDDGHYRIAKGYIKRTLPSGIKRHYAKFKNKFKVYLPDYVFNEYMIMRNRVLEEQIAAAKKMMKE